MEQEFYCLEMKIEIEENNPLVDLKRGLFKDRHVDVRPYLPLPPYFEEGCFVEFIFDRRIELLPLMEKSINERSKKGNGIQIIPNSQRFVDGKSAIDCWVKSPSLDLIQYGALKEYDLLPTGPSEYFFLFDAKKKLLEKVLKPAFDKVNGDLTKIDWSFHDRFEKIRYNSLTLLEGYKLRIALAKGFFDSQDPGLLKELAEELSILAGNEYKQETLVKEVDNIASKLIKYVRK